MKGRGGEVKGKCIVAYPAATYVQMNAHSYCTLTIEAL